MRTFKTAFTLLIVLSIMAAMPADNAVRGFVLYQKNSSTLGPDGKAVKYDLGSACAFWKQHSDKRCHVTSLGTQMSEEAFQDPPLSIKRAKALADEWRVQCPQAPEAEPSFIIGAAEPFGGWEVSCQ